MGTLTAPGRSAGRSGTGVGGRWGRELALGSLFAVLYLCFVTRNYYWDGLSFAIDIEKAQSGRDVINVHHLLYNFIGYGEYLLFGHQVRALYLMQWSNCVLGAALTGLACRLFRSLEVPPLNAIACAAALGASATFWKFTTDADSYILANLFLIAAYLVLPRAPVRGALLHTGALMMHQLAALFYPVALALLWRSHKERFARAAAQYTAVSVGLTLLAYRIAYPLATHKPPGVTFSGWLAYHAQIPFVFSPAAAARWLVVGTARLFVGGKLGPAAYVAGPISLALLVWAIVRIVRSRHALCSLLPEWPLLVWVGAYLMFLFVWEPYNTFYRLFYLTPLVALLAAATRGISPRPLAVLATALFCWNFLVYIYPNTRVERNAVLAFALAQRNQWPPGTGIVFGQFVPDLWTISYFNPQVSWISIEQPDPSRLMDLAREFAKRGGKLYVDWTYLQRTGTPANTWQFERAEPARAP